MLEYGGIWIGTRFKRVTEVGPVRTARYIADSDLSDGIHTTTLPPTMATINDSKSVLVTGATAGIGRALALAIAELPSHPRVIATGRRKDRLEELKKSNLETVEVDLDTDKAGLKKFVDEVLQKYPDVRLSLWRLWSIFDAGYSSWILSFSAPGSNMNSP